MDAKSEVGNLMPDSLTKWLWWLSIVIPPILYGIYPDLPKSWKPQTEEQQFLTRLLISESALLLGSLSLVVLLARHDKMMRLQNAELMNTLDVVSTDAQENGKTVKSLQSKLAVAAQERDTLQTHFDEARQKLTEQQTTIDTLSKTAYDVLKHNKPKELDEPKVKILKILSQQRESIHERSIVTFTRLSDQAVLFHLEELAKYNMASRVFNARDNFHWEILQDGRQYLIDHNML